MNNLICLEVTPQDVRERPMWIAGLSNGLTVYQSDNNPSLKNSNSWLGLKEYCELNNTHVTDMFLRFRDHTEEIGRNREGFFFIKSVLANITGYTQEFYHTGVVQKEEKHLHVVQWIIPEIIPFKSDVRPIDSDLVVHSLIVSRGINSGQG